MQAKFSWANKKEYIPEILTIFEEINLFSHLDESKKMDLCLRSRLRECPADTLIIQEGEEGNSFFLIIRGSVRVFSKDVVIARLEKKTVLWRASSFAGKRASKRKCQSDYRCCLTRNFQRGF